MLCNKITTFVQIVFLVSIASCATKSTNETVIGKPIQTKTPVKIKWVGHWKNEGFKEKLVYDIARQFQFENQDIEIEMKFDTEAYPGVNNQTFVNHQLLLPQSEWDILKATNYKPITELFGGDEWFEKYLVDFSQFEEIRKNSIDFATSEEMKMRYGGILPGPPVDGNNFVLWGNKVVAEKVGITLKQFNITFEELESYIKAVSDYNQKNNTQIHALEFTMGTWATLPLPQQLFASIVGDYEKIKNPKYDEDKVKAWEEVLRMMERLAAYNPLNPDWVKNRNASNTDKPIKGECLFTVNGSWMYSVWQKLDSVKYLDMIPLELPGVKPAKTYIGDIMIPWFVPKNAPHREEAVKFLKYWCRPEVADQWVRHTKSPTGIKGSLVQSTLGFDVYETFDYTIAQKYTGKKIISYYGDHTMMFGEKNAKVRNNFEEVLGGLKSADDAIKEIRKQLIKN